MKELNKSHRCTPVELDKTKGIKDDSEKLPVGTVLLRQFPNAMKALASTSQYGHNKYRETDQDWKNCFRVEEGEERYLNAGIRHLLDAGDDFSKLDESGLPHIRHAVWNLMILLEIIETKDDKGALQGNQN